MSEKIRGYRDLVVWQKAVALVVECYRLTEAFPKTENYGLTSQLRRAATSVPANIAEGRGRRSPKAFLHFLDIAYGSLMEAETLIEITTQLKYITKEQQDMLDAQTAEIGRMLNGLIASIEQHTQRPDT